MNQALLMSSRQSRVLMIGFVVIATSVVAAQWVQARHLAGEGMTQPITSTKAASETLQPSQTTTNSSSSSSGTTKITQTVAKSSDGGTNDSHSSVNVSTDGSSIDVTNTTNQSATSSGNANNSNSEHTSVDVQN